MADTIEKPATDAGYETDFYLWTQQQAAALRDAARMRVNAPIDWENVAEEIESVGGRDRREVKSLARQIMIHLIKLKVSLAVYPRNHWKQEIAAWRSALEDVLDDSPSLRGRLSELAEGEWRKAVDEARHALKDEKSDDEAWAALVFSGLIGPQTERLLDRSYFPDDANDR